MWPRIKKWRTSSRPFKCRQGTIGLNIDFSGVELYTGNGWLVILGYWNTNNRPTVYDQNIEPGSIGFNTDLNQMEYWTGKEWQIR